MIRVKGWELGLRFGCTQPPISSHWKGTHIHRIPVLHWSSTTCQTNTFHLFLLHSF